MAATGLLSPVLRRVLGLIFDADRDGREQGTRSVGIEGWDAAELDLATA